MNAQPGILAPVPTSGRFVVLALGPGADAKAVRARLAELRVDDATVVGIGAPLAPSLAGLHPFETLRGKGCEFPGTQGAIWLFVAGADPGETLHRVRRWRGALGDALRVQEDVLAFTFAGGRDLSGFEDGTENPKDDQAVAAAIVSGRGAGWDGASFVAVQRWVHDLAMLEAMPDGERDDLVGRHRVTNEELAGAPPSAHVKRTAQESFDPPAFMVRRSMPYGGAEEHGLYFVAYGASLSAFERALRRMAGLDDGIVDGLLRYSRVVSGGYYFCPPRLDGGRLDLRALGG